MFVKIHKAYRRVVAVCDEELLGKKFEEGKRQLEIKDGFFGGEQVEEERLIKILKEEASYDSTFNIVGKKSVKASIEAGVVSEEGVLKIQGVPFALVLL